MKPLVASEIFKISQSSLIFVDEGCLTESDGLTCGAVDKGRDNLQNVINRGEVHHDLQIELFMGRIRPCGAKCN